MVVKSFWIKKQINLKIINLGVENYQQIDRKNLQKKRVKIRKNI